MLEQAGAMLRQHPRLESSTAWIRLANLSGSGFELEMQAYVLTRDYDDYAAVREDILLQPDEHRGALRNTAYQPVANRPQDERTKNCRGTDPGQQPTLNVTTVEHRGGDAPA